MGSIECQLHSLSIRTIQQHVQVETNADIKGAITKSITGHSLYETSV